jgi:uncharacterized protein (TIGR02271 family)
MVVSAQRRARDCWVHGR